MPKIRIFMLLAIIVILAIMLITHRGVAQTQVVSPASHPTIHKPSPQVEARGTQPQDAEMDESDVEVGDLNVEIGDVEVGNFNVETNVEVDGINVEDPDMDLEAPDVDEDQHHDDFDSDMPLKEQETIRKTFSLSADHRTLEVDNIYGFIEVVAVDGNQVQMVANKTIRAESKEKIEAAKKEVKLDITEQPDLLKLYVDGPFRCNCNDGCNGWHGDRGYAVSFDFQLQVPRNLDVKLKTVNGGHVNVRGTSGAFLVRNVNGPIEMQDISGSGDAHTVNGSVKASFRENPKQTSDFKTVNGSVELTFVHGLSADFRLKTFNGQVFSDFEMTSLPARQVSGEQRNGKFVFRSDRFTGGRIGNAGPEIKAENLNGDIRILERHNEW
jgi:hypothetical protein